MTLKNPPGSSPLTSTSAVFRTLGFTPIFRLQAIPSRFISIEKSYNKPVDAEDSDTEEVNGELKRKFHGLDPWTVNYYVRCDEIMDELKIADDDREKFMQEHDFSQGYTTLEWCTTSPPPEHTFEESPCVKEIKDGGHH